MRQKRHHAFARLATGEFDAMLWRETAAAALAGVEAKLLAPRRLGQIPSIFAHRFFWDATHSSQGLAHILNFEEKDLARDWKRKVQLEPLARHPVLPVDSQGMPASLFSNFCVAGGSPWKINHPKWGALVCPRTF